MSLPDLDTRLSGLVGGRTAQALEKAFGIQTARDLLWHVPRRYSERGELTPLIGLPVGEHVTVLAQVLDVRERQMQRRNGKLLEVRITDGVGTLQLTFFNQAWRIRELVPGARGIFSGKVSEYRGALQLQHPDYDVSDDYQINSLQDAKLSAAAARAFAEKPVPIYPATAQISSWTIAKTVGVVLDELGSYGIEDAMPQRIIDSEKLLPLADAFEMVHRPERKQDFIAARKSLRFREAFNLQLALLDRRRRVAEVASAGRPVVQGGLLDEFDVSLPFVLTGDQLLAAKEISQELAQPHPMHRMLQGEVGSGKTVVALRAMLQVAESGGQSALLAPTEVLAAQHMRSITEALGQELTTKMHPVLLTSKMPAAERRSALLALASGQAKIAVGTHALMSDVVTFFDLGLIVIDEQHRFGVEQREALRLKGLSPHVLAMTATPIPRTVALTAFGDLEISTIRELPKGRQGIDTFEVPELEMPARVTRVWERVAEDIAAGRQVYVVCPAISADQREEGVDDAVADLGDTAGDKQAPLASVEGTVAELHAHPLLKNVRIAALHGGMSSTEKDSVMRSFQSGETQLLVATTVIEVGVNVPNASIMVVRDADRFGISQLHQLRGRVGRGEHKGLCLLMTKAVQGSLARERIAAIAATVDGFELAERDLELRREGDILGSAQSGGRSTLKLLRVADHGDVIEHAREVAAALLKADPELKSASLLAAQLAAQQQHLDNLAKS